jgi:hypothetical protein
MDLIAEEAGFKDRRSAQRYMRRLEEKKVVVAMTPKTGGHGHDTATIYKLDFDYESAMRRDSTGPEGRQHSRSKKDSKKDEEVEKREWQESTSPSVQPHTPISSKSHRIEENEEGEIKPNRTSDSPPSKNNTMEKRARKVKPDQASVPPPSKNNINPNRHVQGSKKEFAVAPQVARLQAETLRIPLTNGRTFQCNGKVKAIIAEELSKGRSAALILQAAKYVGSPNPPGSQVCRQHIARPRPDARLDSRRQLGGNYHRDGVVAGGG